MIFYEAVDQEGYVHLVGTQADARAINKDFTQVDIPTDKTGLMNYVQQLLRQIDDACVRFTEREENPPVESVDPPKITEREVSYTERSIEIDEIFQNLPLAHQLSLAALAMENARAKVR